LDKNWQITKLFEGKIKINIPKVYKLKHLEREILPQLATEQANSLVSS